MIVVPDAVRLSGIDAFTGVQRAALMQCGTLRDRFAVLDIYDGFKELKADPVKNFRDKIPMNHLDYGVVYYPWLETSALGDDIITTAYIDEKDLEAMLTDEGVISAAALNSIDSPVLLNNTLLSKSPAVRQAMVEIKRQLNRLPPSPAMAGIYSMVDNTRGYGKLRPVRAGRDHDRPRHPGWAYASDGQSGNDATGGVY
jgi:hypothetical protein